MSNQLKFKVSGILIVLALLFASMPKSVVHSQMGGGYICGHWGFNSAPGRAGGWWFSPWPFDNQEVVWVMRNIPPGWGLKMNDAYTRIWHPTIGDYFTLAPIIVDIGQYNVVSNCDPIINLRADNETITAGQCTQLHWNVDVAGLDAVYLGNQIVNPVDQLAVCPTSTEIYTLRAKTTYIQYSPNPNSQDFDHFWVSSTTQNQYSANFTVNVSSPTPPNLKLTNFNLADTLTDFSIMQAPIVLKSNTLWIQITNEGQSPFNPPAGMGKYSLQVILKKPGGKLEEYDYVTGNPSSLEALGPFGPGQSQNLLVTDLYFFAAVDNAELEVFFAPSANLGMQNSILSKTLTIQENPDSFKRCAGKVAQAMIDGVKIAHPELRAVLALPDLAVGTLACGDGGCLVTEAAKWAIGQVLGSIKDAGELLSLAKDILFAMGEPPPCMILADLVNALLHEAIRNNYAVNGVITESPVYPLVTNSAGQRAGFLDDGQIVQEIPGSQVVTIGEKRFVLFPGGTPTNVSLAGYADGNMNLYTTFTQGNGKGITSAYSDVKVTNGMKAILSSSDNQHILKVDVNGDGSFESSITPNMIEVVTVNGIIQQTVEPPTSVPTVSLTATPTIMLSPTPISSPPKGPIPFCNGEIGLTLMPFLFVIWRRSVNRK